MKGKADSLGSSAENGLLSTIADSENFEWSTSPSVAGSPLPETRRTSLTETQLEPLDRFYSMRPPVDEKHNVQSWKQNFRILLYSCKSEPIFINRFEDITLQQWKNVLNSEFFWIDVFQASTSEMDLFQEIFSLKKGTIDTILFGNSGETFESFLNYKFLSTLASKDSKVSSNTIVKEKIGICNIFSIILSKGILTFQRDSFQYRIRVLERISKIGHTWTLSPGWIAYAFLDEVVDSLLPLLRTCEKVTEEFEDLALSLDSSISRSATSRSLNHIASLKHQVLTISKLVCQKHDICQMLTKKVINSKDFKDGMHLYFGDVQDHILSLSQSCSHLEKILTTTHLNYCDQLTLRCIQTDNATFDNAMLLTYVGSGVSILIFVTGFFGINANIPYKSVGDADRREPFYVIFGLAVFVSLIVGYISHVYAVKKIKGTSSS